MVLPRARSRHNAVAVAGVDVDAAVQLMIFPMRTPSMKMVIHSIQIHLMVKRMFSMLTALPIAVAAVVVQRVKALNQARASMKMA